MDDYVRQSFDRNLRIEPLPVVLLRAGNEPETLIENQEIMQCHNVHEFVELFHKKIKEKIPEFQSWSDRPQK